MKKIFRVLLLTTISLTAQYSFAEFDEVKEMVVYFENEPEEPGSHWKPVKVRVFPRLGAKVKREKEETTKEEKNKIGEEKDTRVKRVKIDRLTSPIKVGLISTANNTMHGLGIGIRNFVRTTLKF